MPNMPPTFRPHGQSAKAVARTYERERGTARQRGYDARWERESAAHRRQHPLCAYCELDGVVTVATLTDHLYPHRGDQDVFWFKPWWVSCCKPCHDGMKQRIERLGRSAIDALAARLGLPLRR